MHTTAHNHTELDTPAALPTPIAPTATLNSNVTPVVTGIRRLAQRGPSGLALGGVRPAFVNLDSIDSDARMNHEKTTSRDHGPTSTVNPSMSVFLSRAIRIRGIVVTLDFLMSGTGPRTKTLPENQKLASLIKSGCCFTYLKLSCVPLPVELHIPPLLSLFGGPI
jgi:hypothetical protein